jgi:hypothetical protein
MNNRGIMIASMALLAMASYELEDDILLGVDTDDPHDPDTPPPLPTPPPPRERPVSMVPLLELTSQYKAKSTSLEKMLGQRTRKGKRRRTRKVRY